MVATPPQFAPRTGPIMPKAKDLEEHFAGSPLFMTQLPEEEESSDAFQALQALAFEGSPNGPSIQRETGSLARCRRSVGAEGGI